MSLLQRQAGCQSFRRRMISDSVNVFQQSFHVPFQFSGSLARFTQKENSSSAISTEVFLSNNPLSKIFPAAVHVAANTQRKFINE